MPGNNCGGGRASSPRENSAAAAAAALPRRQFLDWLLGGSVGVWAAAVAAPLLQYLTPLQEAEHTSEIELSQGDKGRVANDGFAIVRFGQERVIVFQDASGQLRALSAKCTHEGCTVTYRSDEQIVWCACHNGRFDRDGLNIAGPPPRPLTPYKVVGKLAGKVLISPKEA